MPSGKWYNKRMAVFHSSSVEETIAWAKQFAETLQTGDVVLLKGEMGAGKTHIAKGIALGLGILEDVTSPTYAYINSYDDRLFHFDCYRISSEEQAEQLGFSDYFDMGGICLVEWSENIAGLLPPDCKIVELIKTGEEEREIRF